MCSNQSLKLYTFLRGVGYKLYFLPFKTVIEEPGRGRVEFCDEGRVRICRVATLIHMSFKVIVMFTIGLIYDRTHDIRMAKRSQYYFLCMCESMGLCFQMCTFLYPRRLFQVEKEFIRFLSGINKRIPTKKDGIEPVLHVFIHGIFSTTLTIIAIVPLFLYHDMHFFGILRAEWWPINAMTTVICMVETFFDWMAVFEYCSLALLYMNSTCRCLRRMKWTIENKPEHGGRRKEDLLQMYRAHQVINNHVMGEGKHMIGFAIALSALIQIFALLLVIRYHERAGIILTDAAAGVFMLCAIITMLLLYLESRVNLLAEEFINSFVRHGAKLTIEQRKSLKALHPMHVPAGNFGPITSHTTLKLLNEVIIKNVVGLLLMSD